jgi:formyl-CoA transferase
MGSHAAVYLMTGKQPTRAGSGVSHLAPYGAYRTTDSYVVVGTLNEQTWQKLCRVLNREDLITDSRFLNLHDRVRHRRELNDILHGVFSTKSSAEWVSIFDLAGLVISPVNTLAEVMEHPQVSENDMIVKTNHPAGTLQLVGAPMTFADWKLAPSFPPPLLGQHTDELLRELSYTQQDIQALRENGVV